MYTPVPWPYGISYFHMPAGRYSDGRLPIDLMGMYFSLDFLGCHCFSGDGMKAGQVWCGSSFILHLIFDGIYNICYQIGPDPTHHLRC